MSTTQKPVANPVEYEKSVYQNGLRYERPPFTFRSTEWESQASMVMSATSKGYVVGNAGTGETAQKNVDAFKKWSIVPSRLVKSEGLPDLSTKIFDQKLQFPIAAAPVGVQRELFAVLFLVDHFLTISKASSTPTAKWQPPVQPPRITSLTSSAQQQAPASKKSPRRTATASGGSSFTGPRTKTKNSQSPCSTARREQATQRS
jgi:hypothetical protein